MPILVNYSYICGGNIAAQLNKFIFMKRKSILFSLVYWFCYPLFRLYDLLSDVAEYDIKKNGSL